MLRYKLYLAGVEATTEMRLDEVARAAGIPTTTVRLYQNKGLLPGPRVVGRTGWYDQGHLSRLRLILRLQEQGFSLAAIARLLETWQAGRDLSALIGVEQQLDDVLTSNRAITVDGARLVEALGSEAVTPDTVRRSVELGLIEPLDDGRFRVRDDRFIETGAALTRLGVPADAILEEWEQLAASARAIADRFVALFDEHLLQPDWTVETITPEAAEQLAATLQQLRRIATTVVGAAVDTALEDLAAERLAELGRHAAAQKRPGGRRRGARRG